jgi:hypothetical protein
MGEAVGHDALQERAHRDRSSMTTGSALIPIFASSLAALRLRSATGT